MKLWAPIDSEVYRDDGSIRMEIFKYGKGGLYGSPDTDEGGYFGEHFQESCFDHYGMYLFPDEKYATRLATWWSISKRSKNRHKVAHIGGGLTRPIDRKVKVNLICVELPDEEMEEKFRVLKLQDESKEWAQFMGKYHSVNWQLEIPFDVVIGTFPMYDSEMEFQLSDLECHMRGLKKTLKSTRMYWKDTPKILLTLAKELRWYG